jgi:hypothetical protein
MDINNEYYHKYAKYKIKYLELQNQQIGGKNKDNKNESSSNIIEFIKKSNINKIKEELPNILFDDKTYCDKIIGQGMMGEVIVSKIGNTTNLKTNGMTINVPVVIKKSHIDGDFDMKIIDNDLYVYGYKNITTEAILLLYMLDLWHKKLSPHLPIIVGYGSCAKQNTSFNEIGEKPKPPQSKVIINKIITERQGLDEQIKIKIKNDNFNEGVFWHPGPDYEFFESNMATMNDLLTYINLFRENDIISLPNSESCNIIKLCDYIAISFLHTYEILSAHNITLFDMHPGNIFIHWLNKKSYMGNMYIGDIKNIIYKFDDKFIKIKTHGFIIKIGDVGSSIVHPKKDVYILGQGNDLDKTYPIVKQLIKPNISPHDFLYNFIYMLPTSLHQKTMAYKILSKYPYSEMRWPSLPLKLVNDQLTASEMLEKFDDYFIKNPVKAEDTLII